MVDIGYYDWWGELLLTEVNSVSQRAYTGLTLSPSPNGEGSGM